MRLYCVRVEIREAATNYAYPVVTHMFFGKTKAEAWGYFEAHKRADGFLRACVERGEFAGGVTCRASVDEGWTQA